MSSPDESLSLIETYYQAAPKGKPIEGGDIIWVPALYLMETTNAIRVDWVKPGDESTVLLKLVSEKEKTLFNHTPIAHPPVRKQEEFLAVKGKVRPAIIVSRPNSEIPKHQLDLHPFPESYVVAPAYGFAGKEDEEYNPEFIARVREFEYHQFFYLPPSDQFGIVESFARLDRVQCIAKRQLRERIATLTPQAFDTLKNMFRFYFWGPPDEEIETFRAIWAEERKKPRS